MNMTGRSNIDSPVKCFSILVLVRVLGINVPLSGQQSPHPGADVTSECDVTVLCTECPKYITISRGDGVAHHGQLYNYYNIFNISALISNLLIKVIYLEAISV